MNGKTLFFLRSWSQIDQKCLLLPIRENIGAQTLRKPPNMILCGCNFGDFSASGRNMFFDGSSQNLFWPSLTPFKRPRAGKGSRRRGQSAPGTAFSEKSAINENACFAGVKAYFLAYGGSRGRLGTSGPHLRQVASAESS